MVVEQMRKSNNTLQQEVEVIPLNERRPQRRLKLIE